MNLKEIIQIALDLVKMDKLPEDSAIYVPSNNDQIKKVLYGIDIGSAELQYAKENGYDCVIAHHPVGLTEHWKVFQRHINQLTSKNIAEFDAQPILDSKMQMFKIGSHSRNYDAVPAFARLINMPFLNIHCPSDELGRRMITKSIEKLEDAIKTHTIADVVTHLESSFPEFQIAKTSIEIVKGKKSSHLGNWIFSHGAFTNGGFDIANLYFQNGIDTVIYIHIAPGELEKVLSLDHGQMIITGHIASDSIGINPFLDQLEKKGIRVTTCGGMLRPN